jgi:hypothetical protein
LPCLFRIHSAKTGFARVMAVDTAKSPSIRFSPLYFHIVCFRLGFSPFSSCHISALTTPCLYHFKVLSSCIRN